MSTIRKLPVYVHPADTGSIHLFLYLESFSSDDDIGEDSEGIQSPAGVLKFTKSKGRQLACRWIRLSVPPEDLPALLKKRRWRRRKRKDKRRGRRRSITTPLEGVLLLSRTDVFEVSLSPVSQSVRHAVKRTDRKRSRVGNYHIQGLTKKARQTLSLYLKGVEMEDEKAYPRYTTWTTSCACLSYGRHRTQPAALHVQGRGKKHATPSTASRRDW